MVQGSVGFGLAMITAPVLLMVNPDFVPGAVMLAATALCVLMAIRERHAIVGREVVVSSVARLVSTVPTAMFVAMIDQRAFNIVFAIAILLGVGISLSGYRAPFNNLNLIIASCVSGVTNTISAVGGPPMALVYQDQPGEHIRATLSAIFAVGSVVAITSLALVGEFGWSDVALGVALLPGVLIGFALSRYTAALLDARTMRPAVLGFAGLSAVLLLGRTLVATS